MNRIKSTLTTWMRSLPLRGEEGWVAPRSVMALMPTHDSRHYNSPTGSHELGGSARKFGQRSGTVHNTFKNTEKETL
jgi:hypothetical protein